MFGEDQKIAVVAFVLTQHGTIKPSAVPDPAKAAATLITSVDMVLVV